MKNPAPYIQCRELVMMIAYPAFMQDVSPADHTVVQVEQTEACLLPRVREHRAESERDPCLLPGIRLFNC
jgi:hypothetical protein